jgi:ankyrin repeat protein
MFALCWRGQIEGWEGSLDEIKLLVESKKVKVNDVDKDNVSALRFAAQFNHLEIVRYLLSQGASTKIKAADGRDALLSAVEQRNVEVVRALLEAGAPTDRSRRESGRPDKLWPLKVARENGHTEMVDLLLEFGATDPIPLSEKCVIA